MKKIKFIITCFIALSMLACTQDDENVNSIYDNINDQTGVGFTSKSTDIVVPITGGVTTSLLIQSTTLSTAARTFPVSVSPESTGSSADYTIGTLSIPACLLYTSPSPRD